MSLIEQARGFMNGIRATGAEVGADDHTTEPATGVPAAVGRDPAADPDAGLIAAELIEEWETQPGHH
jgi:hypothetical protein